MQLTYDIHRNPQYGLLIAVFKYCKHVQKADARILTYFLLLAH